MLPYKSLLPIRRNNGIALHIQICNGFINLITDGTIPPSSGLPSSRVLAELILVNRNTVKLAYEELISQGWAASIERKGIFVLSNLPLLSKQIHQPTDTVITQEASFSWNTHFKGAARSESFQRTTLTIDDGFPDVRLTPIDQLMREYRSISKKFYGKTFLKYGDSKGSEHLRASLCHYLGTTRGLRVQPEEIIITKGSQMGIYLATQLLLSPKDNIAVGVSNYGPADQVVRYIGANLIRIPIDELGMDIDYLEQLLETKTIKAVYIVPHHHFPTTVTMSMERRLKLLALAKKYCFAIIEDDYDFDFHYTKKPYIPLASIDHNNSVIYIGSITKTFAPALRIGFITGPMEFITATASLRHLIDRQGDTLLEEAFASMIDNGELERHFRKSIKIYQQRRDLFCQILHSDFKGSIHFKTPEGGLAVWSVFDKKIHLKELSQSAAKKGLHIGDGSFYINEVFNPNALRLGFASLNETEMSQAFEILKKVL